MTGMEFLVVAERSIRGLRSIEPFNYLVASDLGLCDYH
jgi:hypothetical protein